MHTHFASITDKLAKGIDDGILDTVIVLNLLGLPTVMSCEGHMDGASGAPWVDLEDQEASQQTERIGQLFKVAQAAYSAAQADTAQLFRQAHAARVEALKRHLEVRAKLMDLLELFYEQRQVSYDVMLVIQTKGAGRSRLESQGASFQEIASPDIRAQKLAIYQEEMRAFTAFLKDQYFS